MDNEAASTDLRLTVEVDRGAGAVQRISVRVEGQGVLASQTAARIAELYDRAVADLLRASVSESPPVRQQPVQAVSPPPAADREPDAAENRPAPTLPTAPEDDVREMPSAQPTAPAIARPAPWFQRHRVRISGGVGIVMFLLALGVPLLVPVEMRREILPMPIAFGLVGALSLFSALLPEPQSRSRGSARSVVESAPRMSDPTPALRSAPRRALPVSAGRRVLGAGFGAVFAAGGLIAPFVLAGANPDDRFLMMIGFAPIAAIGAFLIWVFLRQTSAARVGPVVAQRSRTVAPALSKETKMTSALTALAVMLGVIVLLVLAATVLQLAG